MDPLEPKAGDQNYLAYVGPPGRYDFMGATQFRLLCALGLRSHHAVLDLGCGSLRAGKFLISYLEKGRYFGIEPNRWLIEEGIKNQIGEDLVRIKQPRFQHNSDFETGVFSQDFDFILAQSIFSHMGPEEIRLALGRMGESLDSDGLIVATFVEGYPDYDGEGWIYPEIVRYRPATIQSFAKDSNLFATRIPWYHPMQDWYLLARNKNRLPTRRMKRLLRGVVLFDSEFSESWNRRERWVRRAKKALIQRILHPLKTTLGSVAALRRKS